MSLSQKARECYKNLLPTEIQKALLLGYQVVIEDEVHMLENWRFSTEGAMHLS